MYSNHITLVVTGSIAAVKCFDLIEHLQAKKIGVSVLLTDAAHQWITPEAATLVTGNTTHTLQTSAATLASTLAQSGCILIAPASADFIKQLRYQDSPLAEAIMTSGKPVIIAPAMNVMMWHHPATQRNSKTLLSNKVSFLGPVHGNMACGDTGYGRFMEPLQIAEAIAAKLDEQKHEAFAEVQSALDNTPQLPAVDTSLATQAHRKILLMIQGGQDALATYALISSLRSHGYEVTCAATEEVAALLPQQGLATMSNTPAYTHHYQDDVQGMEHIRLPERADIIMVAPATAEGVKEMAEGGAQSFLGCLYLATKKPVVVVPSCDDKHQPASADLKRLQQDGVSLITVPGQLAFASKARADAICNGLNALIEQKSRANIHAG